MGIRRMEKKTFDDYLTEQQQAKMLERAQGDAVWFAKNVLGVKKLWGMQEEILRDFTKYDKFTVSSGHAVGKDYLGAILAIYFLYCFPPSVVVTTAPSDRQVEKVVWREIEKLWNGAKIPLGGKLMSKEIRIENADGEGNDSLCIGFTTKETNQSVGKFQGLHSPNVFVMMTEAQAIDDVIFEQVDSLLVTENSKLYLAGNPLRCDGCFYDSFEDDSFKKYIFSCYDTPNYKTGKELIPGMVTRKWIEDKEKKWGKSSPQFQARVMGQFPKQAMNSLISLSSLRDALNTEGKKGIRVLGIDPARFGADESAFCLMEGTKMLHIDGHHGKPTTETEGKIINLITKTKPRFVVVDEGAMGAGIIDHLEEQIPILKAKGIETEIVPFRFNGKPHDSNFYNLGTEEYFRICGLIEQGHMQMMDDGDLFAQLSSRRYEYQSSTGKMILEGKDKLKKRGLPSPDRADAFVMAASLSVDSMEETEKKDPELFDEDENDDLINISLNPLTGYPIPT